MYSAVCTVDMAVVLRHSETLHWTCECLCVREGHYRSWEVSSFSGYYQIVSGLQSPC